MPPAHSSCVVLPILPGRCWLTQSEPNRCGQVIFLRQQLASATDRCNKVPASLFVPPCLTLLACAAAFTLPELLWRLRHGGSQLAGEHEDAAVDLNVLRARCAGCARSHRAHEITLQFASDDIAAGKRSRQYNRVSTLRARRQTIRLGVCTRPTTASTPRGLPRRVLSNWRRTSTGCKPSSAPRKLLLRTLSASWTVNDRSGRYAPQLLPLGTDAGHARPFPSYTCGSGRRPRAP